MSLALKVWDLLGRDPRPVLPAEPKVKEPYPYRFNFIIASLFVFALVALGSVIVRGVGLSSTRVETRTVQVDRPLTSADDLRESLGPPTDSVAGADMGVNLKTCDIWQGKADLTVVCHN